ncbi:hypothetical protein K458DRAFT_413425 [Lentithecium fluviatile CBS 122367]|uniref:Uncharacterized protein n=1 Tax=Lentithecium fluviatile CBS 122367 TaxID=1168545 RepID=A0A6G1JG57_9PLEO|nr:hypothetical protein K458DRAFT_413425 [Lentithecium fluviatile CBS 122367]
MPYLVSPATEPEISHIITIMFCAYAGRNEYINVVFPEGLTPGGHALTVQRLLFIQSVAPCVWWNKVVDEATGELLGGAMWNLCVREKPPAYEMDGPEGTWDTEEDKRYAQALQRSFVEDEGQIWDRERLPILGMFACLCLCG